MFNGSHTSTSIKNYQFGNYDASGSEMETIQRVENECKRKRMNDIELILEIPSDVVESANATHNDTVEAEMSWRRKRKFVENVSTPTGTDFGADAKANNLRKNPRIIENDGEQYDSARIETQQTNEIVQHEPRLDDCSNSPLSAMDSPVVVSLPNSSSSVVMCLVSGSNGAQVWMECDRLDTVDVGNVDADETDTRSVRLLHQPTQQLKQQSPRLNEEKTDNRCYNSYSSRYSTNSGNSGSSSALKRGTMENAWKIGEEFQRGTIGMTLDIKIEAIDDDVEQIAAQSCMHSLTKQPERNIKSENKNDGVTLQCNEPLGLWYEHEDDKLQCKQCSVRLERLAVVFEGHTQQPPSNQSASQSDNSEKSDDDEVIGLIEGRIEYNQQHSDAVETVDADEVPSSNHHNICNMFLASETMASESHEYDAVPETDNHNNELVVDEDIQGGCNVKMKKQHRLQKLRHSTQMTKIADRHSTRKKVYIVDQLSMTDGQREYANNKWIDTNITIMSTSESSGRQFDAVDNTTQTGVQNITGLPKRRLTCDNRMHSFQGQSHFSENLERKRGRPRKYLKCSNKGELLTMKVPQQSRRRRRVKKQITRHRFEYLTTDDHCYGNGPLVHKGCENYCGSRSENSHLIGCVTQDKLECCSHNERDIGRLKPDRRNAIVEKSSKTYCDSILGSTNKKRFAKKHVNTRNSGARTANICWGSSKKKCSKSTPLFSEKTVEHDNLSGDEECTLSTSLSSNEIVNYIKPVKDDEYEYNGIENDEKNTEGKQQKRTRRRRRIRQTGSVNADGVKLSNTISSLTQDISHYLLAAAIDRNRQPEPTLNSCTVDAIVSRIARLLTNRVRSRRQQSAANRMKNRSKRLSVGVTGDNGRTCAVKCDEILSRRIEDQSSSCENEVDDRFPVVLNATADTANDVHDKSGEIMARNSNSNDNDISSKENSYSAFCWSSEAATVPSPPYYDDVDGDAGDDIVDLLMSAAGATRFHRQISDDIVAGDKSTTELQRNKLLSATAKKRDEDSRTETMIEEVDRSIGRQKDISAIDGMPKNTILRKASQKTAESRKRRKSTPKESAAIVGSDEERQEKNNSDCTMTETQTHESNDTLTSSLQVMSRNRLKQRTTGQGTSQQHGDRASTIEISSAPTISEFATYFPNDIHFGPIGTPGNPSVPLWMIPAYASRQSETACPCCPINGGWMADTNPYASLVESSWWADAYARYFDGIYSSRCYDSDSCDGCTSMPNQPWQQRNYRRYEDYNNRSSADSSQWTRAAAPNYRASTTGDAERQSATGDGSDEVDILAAAVSAAGVPSYNAVSPSQHDDGENGQVAPAEERIKFDGTFISMPLIDDERSSDTENGHLSLQTSTNNEPATTVAGDVNSCAKLTTINAETRSADNGKVPASYGDGSLVENVTSRDKIAGVAENMNDVISVYEADDDVTSVANYSLTFPIVGLSLFDCELDLQSTENRLVHDTESVAKAVNEGPLVDDNLQCTSQDIIVVENDDETNKRNSSSETVMEAMLFVDDLHDLMVGQSVSSSSATTSALPTIDAETVHNTTVECTTLYSEPIAGVQVVPSSNDAVSASSSSNSCIDVITTECSTSSPVTSLSSSQTTAIARTSSAFQTFSSRGSIDWSPQQSLSSAPVSDCYPAWWWRRYQRYNQRLPGPERCSRWGCMAGSSSTSSRYWDWSSGSTDYQRFQAPSVNGCWPLVNYCRSFGHQPAQRNYGSSVERWRLPGYPCWNDYSEHY